MTQTDKTTLKRILVALDESPPGLAALEVATHLASQLHADLQALFVEDDNLLKLAGLPFSHEIDFTSAVARPLDRSAVEQIFRTKANQIREAIATTAHRASVRWSFQVTRGRVTAEALAAAREMDAVVMGRESSPLKSFADATARGDRNTIVVVYDGSPGGRRVLEIAQQFAAIRSDPIFVFVNTSEPEQAGRLRQEAIDSIDQQVQHATVSGELLSDAHELSVAVEQTHARLVVLNRDNLLLDERTVECLVNELDCPIALVR